MFTDQAVPTGGLSGTLLVYRGLIRRGVAGTVALTALLVGMISFYAAYLAAVLLAFSTLRWSGYVNTALTYGVTIFALIALALPISVLLLVRVGRSHSFGFLRRFPTLTAGADMTRQARPDLLTSPRLLSETFALQLAIFALDAVTLWAVYRAIGETPHITVAFVAVVMGSAAATIGPVPLGLGTFEAACTEILHLQGMAIEPAVTATLLLGGLTFWLPMLPGLLLARRELRRSAAPFAGPTA
ncbi:hypothetical protein 374 [Lutibaculum baratangense AMV1]|uniref:Uncharacterized protein n=1 Tax=Lutibaculum baratangense AMV1 TaxID=631454 RepID=V4RCU4_9HYPH|nr:hypothetical protein 374 [Lutibaculum baratangense AMV1]